MARTRQFNPEQALEKAVQVFWDRGYSDTSMDDLVKATGVSRYGFYGTFGSKFDLFEKVMERYAHGVMAHQAAGLRGPGAGLAEIRSYFDNLLSMPEADLRGRGCLLATTAVEVAPHDKRVAKLVRRYFDQMAKVLENALRNAVKAGDLEIPSSEIPGKALLLTGAMQGLAVMARAGFDLKTARAYVETLLDSLG